MINFKKNGSMSALFIKLLNNSNRTIPKGTNNKKYKVANPL